MNTLQTEIIRLIKTGRNTVAELSINTGLTQHRVRVMLGELESIGLVNSNMVKNEWFV